MVKYLLVVLSLSTVMFSFGCASLEARRIRFSGGSIIAQGFRLHEDKGEDTPARIGSLKSKSGVRIDYSIFSYDAVFADPARLEMFDWDVLWSRSSGSDVLHKITTLAKGRILKTEVLYISFPNAGPANFIASVSSKEQIEEVESVVSTFRP